MHWNCLSEFIHRQNMFICQFFCHFDVPKDLDFLLNHVIAFNNFLYQNIALNMYFYMTCILTIFFFNNKKL